MSDISDRSSESSSPADTGEARLDGTSALVVGANGGIGKGIVHALVAAGCSVVASDIQPKPADDLAGTTYFPADLTDEQAVRELFRSVMGSLTRIDIVVNSAGIGHVDPLESLSLEIWRKVFAINVEAALLVSQAAARQMVEQEPSPSSERRGLIVHVTSPAAERGRPLSAAYGASKAALNHLSKSMAAVFGDRQVSTAVLAPGAVGEGMLTYLLPEIGRLGGAELLEEREAGASLFKQNQSPYEIGSFVVAIATQPGMTWNGMELWTMPTSGPIS